MSRLTREVLALRAEQRRRNTAISGSTLPNAMSMEPSGLIGVDATSRRLARLHSLQETVSQVFSSDVDGALLAQEEALAAFLDVVKDPRYPHLLTPQNFVVASQRVRHAACGALLRSLLMRLSVHKYARCLRACRTAIRRRLFSRNLLLAGALRRWAAAFPAVEGSVEIDVDLMMETVIFFYTMNAAMQRQERTPHVRFCTRADATSAAHTNTKAGAACISSAGAMNTPAASADGADSRGRAPPLPVWAPVGVQGRIGDTTAGSDAVRPMLEAMFGWDIALLRGVTGRRRQAAEVANQTVMEREIAAEKLRARERRRREGVNLFHRHYVQLLSERHAEDHARALMCLERQQMLRQERPALSSADAAELAAQLVGGKDPRVGDALAEVKLRVGMFAPGGQRRVSEMVVLAGRWSVAPHFYRRLRDKRGEGVRSAADRLEESLADPPASRAADDERNAAILARANSAYFAGPLAPRRRSLLGPRPAASQAAASNTTVLACEERTGLAVGGGKSGSPSTAARPRGRASFADSLHEASLISVSSFSAACGERDMVTRSNSPPQESPPPPPLPPPSALPGARVDSVTFGSSAMTCSASFAFPPAEDSPPSSAILGIGSRKRSALVPQHSMRQPECGASHGDSDEDEGRGRSRGEEGAESNASNKVHGVGAEGQAGRRQTSPCRPAPLRRGTSVFVASAEREAAVRDSRRMSTAGARAAALVAFIYSGSTPTTDAEQRAEIRRRLFQGSGSGADSAQQQRQHQQKEEDEEDRMTERVLHAGGESCDTCSTAAATERQRTEEAARSRAAAEDAAWRHRIGSHRVADIDFDRRRTREEQERSGLFAAAASLVWEQQQQQLSSADSLLRSSTAHREGSTQLQMQHRRLHSSRAPRVARGTERRLAGTGNQHHQRCGEHKHQQQRKQQQLAISITTDGKAPERAPAIPPHCNTDSSSSFAADIDALVHQALLGRADIAAAFEYVRPAAANSAPATDTTTAATSGGGDESGVARGSFSAAVAADSATPARTMGDVAAAVLQSLSYYTRQTSEATSEAMLQQRCVAEERVGHVLDHQLRASVSQIAREVEQFIATSASAYERQQQQHQNSPPASPALSITASPLSTVREARGERRVVRAATGGALFLRSLARRSGTSRHRNTLALALPGAARPSSCGAPDCASTISEEEFVEHLFSISSQAPRAESAATFASSF